MSEREQLQRRWIEGARQQQAPPADAVARMRRGLVARIAAGEPAPALEASPSAAGPRMGPWLAGGGILLVAAALLVWLSGSTAPQRTVADASQAASYEAKDDGSAYTVAPKKRGGFTVAPPSQAEAVAMPDDSPAEPHAAVPSSAGEVRAPASGAGPHAVEPRAAPQEAVVPSQKSGAPAVAREAPPLQRPSTKAPLAVDPKADEHSALDVAGEAALLRAATTAIEAEQWTRAGAALRDYTSRYPHGVLRPEATALRVVVNCGRGAPRATKAAVEFLRTHPSSPVRERIRRACAIASSP